MRAVVLNLLIAAGLLLMVLCGVQVYHLALPSDPAMAMMDRYGVPAVGDAKTIQAEWQALQQRAQAHNTQSTKEDD